MLQLLKLLDQWVESQDQGRNVNAMVYMDFQDAFNKVPYKHLLSTLRGYGMGGEIEDWVSSFVIVGITRYVSMALLQLWQKLRVAYPRAVSWDRYCLCCT